MYFPKVQLGTTLTRPLQPRPPTRRTPSVPDWCEKHLSLCLCLHQRVTVMLWLLRRIIHISVPVCMLSSQHKPSNCLHSVKLSALLSAWNLTVRGVFGRYVSLTFDFIRESCPWEMFLLTRQSSLCNPEEGYHRWNSISEKANRRGGNFPGRMKELLLFWI